jgi:hypothetical protein
VTSRASFWPSTYICNRENISETYWRLITHVSQHGTNACTSAYKKSVSSVRRWEVTACFTSASVANRVPTNRFLRGLNRWKSLRPHTANQTCGWFLRYGCEMFDQPPYRSIPCTKIPICLDPFWRTYLVSDLQQPPTWSKQSPSG